MKIDDVIENTAYIKECLQALKEIWASGCCNDCAVRKDCKYAPKPGELVRYNCPHYEPEQRSKGS